MEQVSFWAVKWSRTNFHPLFAVPSLLIEVVQSWSTLITSPFLKLICGAFKSYYLNLQTFRLVHHTLYVSNFEGKNTENLKSSIFEIVMFAMF
jgi:hypothetical protein